MVGALAALAKLAVRISGGLIRRRGCRAIHALAVVLLLVVLLLVLVLTRFVVVAVFSGPPSRVLSSSSSSLPSSSSSSSSPPPVWPPSCFPFVSLSSARMFKTQTAENYLQRSHNSTARLHRTSPSPSSTRNVGGMHARTLLRRTTGRPPLHRLETSPPTASRTRWTIDDFDLPEAMWLPTRVLFAVDFDVVADAVGTAATGGLWAPWSASAEFGGHFFRPVPDHHPKLS